MKIICSTVTYYTFPRAKVLILGKLETLLREELAKDPVGSGLKEYWFIIKIAPDYVVRQENEISNEFRHIKNRKKYLYSPLLADFYKVQKMPLKQSNKVLFALFMDSINYLEELHIKDFDSKKFKKIAIGIGKKQKWV